MDPPGVIRPDVYLILIEIFQLIDGVVLVDIFFIHRIGIGVDNIGFGLVFVVGRIIFHSQVVFISFQECAASVKRRIQEMFKVVSGGVVVNLLKSLLIGDFGSGLVKIAFDSPAGGIVRVDVVSFSFIGEAVKSYVLQSPDILIILKSIHHELDIRCFSPGGIDIRPVGQGAVERIRADPVLEIEAAVRDNVF
ncbi:hypothetical protein FQZ97_916360 [compost metagenome]